MIRPRQKLPLFTDGVISLPEVVTLENGSCEVRLVNQADSDLPDWHTTDLDLVLESGVNLQLVNSKVLSPKPVTAEFKNETSNTKTSEE